MSSDALVERMSNAVRAAYKAMEVLKSENQALKAENETLRKQLSEFLPSQSATSKATHEEKVPPAVTSVINESAVLIRPTASVEMALPRIPQQKPIQLPTVSTKGEEVGTSTFKYRSFPNAPGAVKLERHLKQLGVDNLHYMASTLAGQSPVTLCKALSLTITAYIQSDGIGRIPAGIAEIPIDLTLKLDQLVSLVVSICSRGECGLVKVHKLLDVLRKVICGAVRCQLCAPHYATVTGVLRAARNISPSLRKVASDAVTDLRNSERVAERSEPAQSPKTNQEAPTEDAHVDKKQWISSLSTMFGLDSSDDSGSDGDATERREESDHGDEVMFTADAWSAEDGAKHAEKSGDEGEDSVDGGSSDSEDSVGQDVPAAFPLGNPDDVENHDGEGGQEATAEHSAADRPEDVLNQACRVYVLLATLLRTALHQELIATLDQIGLITTHNFSDSCAIGVIAVFGSRRYGSEFRQDVVQAVRRLVTSWLRSPVESGECGDDRAIPKEIHNGLASLRQRFDRHAPPPASTETSVDAAALVAEAEGILHRAVSGEELQHDEDCIAACRSLGFWASADILATKDKSGRPPVAHGAVFETVGLDRVAAQAATWCALLRAWDPAKPPAMSDSHTPDGAPALVGFLQSEDFCSSGVQGSVIAALKAKDVSPLKFTAQDALVEVFASQWVKGLSPPSKDSMANTAAMLSATQAAQALRNLFQSVYSTEYDAAEGGWRTGLSGAGHRLQSRLQNRRSVGVALMNKLPGVRHFTSSAMMVVLKPPLYWQHLSSCPGRNLLEAAQFVDHCAQYVFANEWGGNDSSEADDTIVTVKKLHAVCADMVAALALAAVENVTAVAVSSVRGLLRALGGHPSLSAARGTEEAAELVHAVDRFLAAIPAPWAGPGRADIRCELQLCTRAVLAATPLCRVGESRRNLRLLSCARILRAAQELPVFVINLDKRTDRLWTSFLMLDQARISAVRVLAWDGTSEGTTTSSSSAAEMFHKNFSRAGDAAQELDASDAAGSAPSLRRRWDAYSDIPERDVALTWDSSINAMFDARCAAHTAVIATASERACAASHLKVWRAIADLCGIKQAGQSGRAVSSLKLLKPTELSSARDELGRHSEAEVYRALTGDTSSSSSATAAPDTDALHRRLFTGTSAAQDYFVVLEDDATFPQQSLADLRATIRDLMAALPADVDLLYLGGLLPKAAPAFKQHHKKGEPFLHVNYVWTLQAYVLRRRAVEVLLSKLPIWAPVDNFVASLIYHKELKACIVKDKLTQKPPPLNALSRKEDSDIRPSGRTLQVVRKRTGHASGGSGKKHKKRGRKS